MAPGGDGGSITILSVTGAEAKAHFEEGVANVGATYRVLPIRLSRVGIQVQGALH